MAKSAWLTVSPMSGSGNQTLQNTGTEHTGREQRTTTVTGIASGVSPNRTYTVIQQPKAEFVSFDQSEVTVAKEGGTLTITGRSNSSKLTFTLADPNVGDENDIVLELPKNYTAGGSSTANGVEITGDPGATAEYEFSIQFTGIAANTTINELIAAVKVVATGGQSAQVLVKQTAGDPTFEFGQKSITLTSAGTAVSNTVVSNTSWTIE